ncbi:MAG: hypothetical protein A2096_01900 [Spirochaetes bacterium GWF1_41_5]|nr:MAG: hypothetical protein A2096_01900 [Spirochaetes bacterium GWF1_41_5]
MLKKENPVHFISRIFRQSFKHVLFFYFVRIIILQGLFLFFVVAQYVFAEIKWNPGHYVLETPNTGEDWMIISNNSYFKGLKIGVLWRMVEPEKNQFNWEKIDSHLKQVKAMKKHLMVYFLDRVFRDQDPVPVPDYILKGKEYNGGVVKHGSINTGQGMVARLWDPVVMKELNRVICAMGERYDRDPNFEAVFFDETALNIDMNPHKSGGYTDDNYIKCLIERLNSAKKAFPNTMVFQHINYFPCVVDALYKYYTDPSTANGVGFGGSDLVPDLGRTKKTRNYSYQYFPKSSGLIPLAMDVQTPNFTRQKGNFSSSLNLFFDMGIDTLKLNYIIWSMPNKNWKMYDWDWDRDIFPYVSSRKGYTHTNFPAMIIKK